MKYNLRNCMENLEDRVVNKDIYITLESEVRDE